MDFNNVQSKVSTIFGDINRNTQGIKVLDNFEQQTAMPRSYAVLGAAGFYLLMVFMNVGGIGQLLSNVAGFVYPGYLSLQALRTSTTSDDTRLLTYWVVFAFMNVIEFWASAILYWVPAYFFFKTIFLVYLASPLTNGAALVYKMAIEPISDQIFAGPSPADELASKVQDKVQ